LTKTDLLDITQKGRVFHIALNRPEKRNALNIELCRSLVEAFDHADCAASVGAILLTANGPAFCAGMDLAESICCDQIQLGGIHDSLFTVINRVRKPIIAAVTGAAFAGGAGLAANSHILVADPDARFGLTEIRIGLWPVLIFRAIEHAIGERRAVELSLTGRIFTAAEAYEWGLVTEISPTPEARAAAIAATISEFSPQAIGAGLDFVHHTRGQNWEHSGRIGRQSRDRLLAAEDYKEGVRAFLEKRAPVWPSLKGSAGPSLKKA
jgi:enoyl-CoA hydratase/carnithine racemase